MATDYRLHLLLDDGTVETRARSRIGAGDLFRQAEVAEMLADSRCCGWDVRSRLDADRFAELAEEAVSAGTVLLAPYSGDVGSRVLGELPAVLLTQLPRLTGRFAVVVQPQRLLAADAYDDAEDSVQDALIALCRRDPDLRVRIADDLGAAADAALLPPLSPGMRDGATSSMRRRLDEFDCEDHFGRLASPADGVALRAGLYQLHDCLDRSHDLAQEVQGEGRHAAGDYWHAIMHRREPDYGNSKYWYRRVGRHPLFTELAPQAEDLLETCEAADAEAWRSRLCSGGGWDPFAFIDLCAEAADDESGPLGQAARRIQWLEMLLLLKHTWRDAIGKRYSEDY